MARYLVDEDLPRSLVRDLRSAGITAQDVGELNLRGKRDDEIFQYAIAKTLTLLTADLGFGNLVRFPIGSHSGIVIIRYPMETSTNALSAGIVNSLRQLTDEEIAGNLVVLEPGRIRLRRTN